jgi:hypothetical protein
MIRSAVVATLAAFVSIAAPSAVALADPAPPPGTGTATTFDGTPTVGALYDTPTTDRHSCTASVVSSPRGDVLLTAAHCVAGTGAGYVFAPGFHGGVSPLGRWTVTGAYLDPAWLSGQDPRRDFAFLTVAPQRIDGRLTQIQAVTGANRLGLGAFPGEQVTIPAYRGGPTTTRSPARPRSTSRASIRPSTVIPTSAARAARRGSRRPRSGPPWPG